MGVYIKDIEMPVCCMDCLFEADTTYVCRLTNKVTKKDHQSNVKPEWCPLMELKEREDGLYEHIN